MIIVFKLDFLGHGSKELIFCPLLFQQRQRPVRSIAALDQSARHVLKFNP